MTMTVQGDQPGLPLALTGATRLFAIVGDPIDQAGSPGLFNQAFRRLNRPAVLVPLHLPQDGLDALLQMFRRTRNWDGLVVTIPHKIELAGRMDVLGAAARRTGAVNAIRKLPDGRLAGDNFDGEGFLRGLPHGGKEIRGAEVLLVGAGGAGRAIAHALADAGAARLGILDRDSERAAGLAAAVKAEHPGAGEVSLELEASGGYDVLVNCTPPDGVRLPFDLAMARPGALVVDIVLKPPVTPLLEAASARGLRTHPGIHMLSGQVDAILAFFDETAPTPETARPGRGH